MMLAIDLLITITSVVAVIATTRTMILIKKCLLPITIINVTTLLLCSVWPSRIGRAHRYFRSSGRSSSAFRVLGFRALGF